MERPGTGVEGGDIDRLRERLAPAADATVSARGTGPHAVHAAARHAARVPGLAPYQHGLVRIEPIDLEARERLTAVARDEARPALRRIRLLPLERLPRAIHVRRPAVEAAVERVPLGAARRVARDVETGLAEREGGALRAARLSPDRLLFRWGKGRTTKTQNQKNEKPVK